MLSNNIFIVSTIDEWSQKLKSFVDTYLNNPFMGTVIFAGLMIFAFMAISSFAKK